MPLCQRRSGLLGSGWTHRDSFQTEGHDRRHVVSLSIALSFIAILPYSLSPFFLCRLSLCLPSPHSAYRGLVSSYLTVSLFTWTLSILVMINTLKCLKKATSPKFQNLVRQFFFFFGKPMLCQGDDCKNQAALKHSSYPGTVASNYLPDCDFDQVT